MMTTPANATTGKVALIEAHDAKVETFVLRTDQTCGVHFRHLAVYHAQAVETFAIWSYRATLELSDVSRFLSDGASAIGDYVSDAIVFHEGTPIEWEALLERAPATRVEMTFGSGRKVEIDCSEAHLVLQEPLKHFEDWRGPL